MDSRVRQIGICRRPASAVVGGKKDAPIRPGKEIHADDRQRIDRSARQAATRGSPGCANVGGKKDAGVTRPGKEIRARNRKAGNAATDPIGLHPLGLHRRTKTQ